MVNDSNGKEKDKNKFKQQKQERLISKKNQEKQQLVNVTNPRYNPKGSRITGMAKEEANTTDTGIKNVATKEMMVD